MPRARKARGPRTPRDNSNDADRGVSARSSAPLRRDAARSALAYSAQVLPGTGVGVHAAGPEASRRLQRGPDGVGRQRVHAEIASMRRLSRRRLLPGPCGGHRGGATGLAAQATGPACGVRRSRGRAWPDPGRPSPGKRPVGGDVGVPVGRVGNGWRGAIEAAVRARLAGLGVGERGRRPAGGSGPLFAWRRRSAMPSRTCGLRTIPWFCRVRPRPWPPPSRRWSCTWMIWLGWLCLWRCRRSVTN